MKFHCPSPRSASSSIKSGPCGPGSTPGAAAAVLSPGLQTIHLQETIKHRGAPARLALSTNNADDFEDCILLNHIPHKLEPSSVGYYSLTVTIPDIDCESCTLQLIQFMTDKAADDSCTFDPTIARGGVAVDGGCSSNYFSCADVTITGSVAVGDFSCPAEDADWPFAGMPVYEYSKGEAAGWETLSGGLSVLQDAPDKFRDVTGVCAQAANLPPVTSLEEDDDDDDDDELNDELNDEADGVDFAVVGGASGGVVALGIAAVVLVNKRRRHRPIRANMPRDLGQVAAPQSDLEGDLPVSSSSANVLFQKTAPSFV